MRFLIAAYLAALLSLAGVAVAGAVAVFRDSRPDDPIEAVADDHGFNFVTWELRHLPEKWLYEVGHLFARDASEDEANQALLEYFLIVADLRRLEEQEPGSPEIARLEAERASRENEVEDILESRMTTILEDQGLTMSPAPFTELDMIFPPVDFELEAPTRVLAVSPRDRIELQRDFLLTPGLSLETAIGIEQEVEAGNAGDTGVAALVVTTGGVGTYPAVVSSRSPSASLIDTAFHEWIHNYLAFYPLGSRYFEGDDLRTINESVADLAGRELAKLYTERYGELRAPAPSETPGPAASPSPRPGEEQFDFTAEMRALRVEVEELLADSKITEAESLMAEKRDYFEEHGHYIRRLNQAYFAFYGFYGDSPASIDPIGPKVNELFEASGSVGEFVRRAASITSEDELSAAVAGRP
jgi:hypothetical protein